MKILSCQIGIILALISVSFCFAQHGKGQFGNHSNVIPHKTSLPKIFKEGNTQPFAEAYSESVGTAWIAHYGSGIAPADDFAECIAVDTFGNVYVTGNSFGSGTLDFVTIKYNTNGDIIWERRYNGTGDFDDYPSDLTVDKAGNVYVTGSSKGLNTNYDFATIKYNSSGDSLWVRRYNGPGNQIDEPTSLEVDDSGYVYVTGLSLGIASDYDATTIKYDADGEIAWIARYNGSANGREEAYAVKVDSSGNVFVAGSTFNGLYQDFLTIKYNSAGDTLWTRKNKNPNNSDAVASLLNLDATGNPIITGYSGYKGYHSCFTIKYTKDGDSLWSKSFPGSDNNPQTQLIDSQGNIIIAGYANFASTSYDYLTIKYSSNGDSLWAKQYNNTGNSDDKALDAVVDTSGNIFITGASKSGSDYDYTTIKYSPTGILLWQKNYLGSNTSNDWAKAIALDKNGNVFVTGFSNDGDRGYNYATIKYSNNGNQVWVRTYDGYGKSSDYSIASAVDDLGNIYVTGYITNVQTYKDIITIKYSPAGDTIWTRTFTRDGYLRDVPIAIVVDCLGDVYVTGLSDGIESADIITIKYSSNGVVLWAKFFDGKDRRADVPRAIALDNLGNVFVTGLSYTIYNATDVITIKYNSLGDTVWVRSYNGGRNIYDIPEKLRIDKNGYIYIIGNVYIIGEPSDINDTSKFLTIKYTANGDLMWAKGFYVNESYSNSGVDIAIDDSDNIYVCGQSDSKNNDYYYTLIKYNSSGDTTWTRRFSNSGKNEDFAIGLVLDDSSNIYVAGYSYYSITSNDFVTIKYNSSGDTLWTQRYNGPANYHDVATAMAIDHANNIYITGYSEDLLGYPDFTTIKFTSNGVLDWVRQYNGPYNASDKPSDITVDKLGNVIVTGTSTSNDWSLFTTIKYVQTPDDVTEKETGIPAKFSLTQNYPNPFNPTTTIKYELPSSNNVSLKIYNLLGQEVATLVDGVEQAGYKSVEWKANNVSSGVYIYRLVTSTGFSSTKRMLIIK